MKTRTRGGITVAVGAVTCVLAVVFSGTVASAQHFVLQEVGTFAHTTNFDEGASEISTFDPATDTLFVVNGETSGVDVLDISDPENPVDIGSMSIGGGEVTSTAVHNGVVAVTASGGKGLPGILTFFDATSRAQLGAAITVGAVPDMVTFTPDGNKILVAHEGEPDYGAGLDPVGSIGIFAPTGGVNTASVAALTATDMVTAGFGAFDSQKATLQAAGVRIFGDPGNTPGFTEADTTVSEDLEPEFIAVSSDSTKAWVTLQENNAMAIVDLTTNSVSEIKPLGTKDHSVAGQGLDASDEDGAINIATWPVKGMYMSDAIARYEAGGQDYVLMANEGDDRGEDERIKNLTLDPTAFPTAATLQAKTELGRLKVSTVDGDTDGDSDYDELYSFGARSFTIRDADGNIVYDSGDTIEQMIAAEIPTRFNSDNDDPTFDGKSDSQGPEPEGIAVGTVGGTTLAFVGMEDVGGIMLFDITDPTSVAYQSYFNDRDWAAEDLNDFSNSHTGPEGLLFIDAGDSPTGEPLLVVSYEVTGTTGIYSVEQVPEPSTMGLLCIVGPAGLVIGRRRRG